MDVIKENINNLTSLWQTVGAACGVFSEEKNCRYSLVSESQWPNRIWLNNSADKAVVADIAQLAATIKSPMGLSYWADFGDPGFELFDTPEFELKSQQIGMSMQLDRQRFKFDHRVELKRITNTSDADIWEKLYPQSFGYVISGQTVKLTKDRVNYYIIFYHGEPIGTAIVYNTDNVVGIHGMGIIPSFRKQGFAEEVLMILLNKAKGKKKSLATLQASAMGRAIYKKIGFSEDFLMKNYSIR